MSAQAFNRIAELEKKVELLQQQVLALTKSQACENEPSKSTLTLRKKAEPSHA